ncbi:unnamed protein product, partial [Meganyctiphanes norvegica]
IMHTYRNTCSFLSRRQNTFLRHIELAIFLEDFWPRHYLSLIFSAFVKHCTISDLKRKGYGDTVYIGLFWNHLIMEKNLSQLTQHMVSKNVPKLIVLGSATHAIKNFNGSALALEEYKKNLTSLSSALNQIGNRTRVLWMLQDPVLPERLKPERAVITNDQLEDYNKAAMEVLYGTAVRIWSSSRLVAQGSITGFADGIHAGPTAVKYDSQVYLHGRTNFFMRENKYFSQLNFWLPLGYVFALGLFFTEDTRHTRLLHRDMTDEWKGWMQLVILVYHMTGASQVLPVYMHIRVLVSAYLFLTGYGHFSYYWAGRDMGIVRYCQVMFRINFLVISLCLIMNRPYQFYYFVPLVSFWYTVLHITLVLPPRITRPSHVNSEAQPINYFYAIVKFIGLGGFITVLFLSEVFFEKIFVMRLWKALFVTTDDDIHEWWFRWQLDRYSLLYGMVFAMIYAALTQFGFIDDKSGSNLLCGRLALLVSFFATLFLGSYSSMTFFCTNKPDCNEIHPYVAFVPIVGYIILRNIVGSLRTRYSSFFAWFGRISLELFVCQYHIWLAADTHGVLVLIPQYPVANVLVTSFIFICICHEVNHITNVITPYLVPNDSFRAIRNLGVFSVFLFSIAFHNGVF